MRNLLESRTGYRPVPGLYNSVTTALQCATIETSAIVSLWLATIDALNQNSSALRLSLLLHLISPQKVTSMRVQRVGFISNMPSPNSSRRHILHGTLVEVPY
jgi:hypothetical protein